MRRAALPLALLPGAALGHDVLPAGTEQLARAQLPALEQGWLPPAQVAIARWELPADNPWSAYSKWTLLAWLGPSPVQLELPDARARVGGTNAECAARTLAFSNPPRETAWLVDLPGAESVAFGATFTELAGQPLSPVLTFNNWPQANELVPAEDTLSALLEYAPRLPLPGEPGAPVFLLDAWRLSNVGETVAPGVFDNRYLLTSADLPAADALTARGIRQVVYLVENLDQMTHALEDVHPILLSYQEAGLGVSMIDLRELCRPTVDEGEPLPTGADIGGWSGWYRRWTLRLEPRREHRVEALFRSSPGGFGGPHATPIHLGGGVIGGIHGGGG
jgi:hypothetical protein